MHIESMIQMEIEIFVLIKKSSLLKVALISFTSDFVIHLCSSANALTMKNKCHLFRTKIIIKGGEEDPEGF